MKKKHTKSESASFFRSSGGSSLLEVDLSLIITLVVVYQWSSFSFAEFTFYCLLKCLQHCLGIQQGLQLSRQEIWGNERAGSRAAAWSWPGQQHGGL